ncbi:hypothetical protein BH10CHL1_BH10CHL1_42400 [soil metagenome]
MRKTVRVLVIFVLALAVYWGTAVWFKGADTPDTAYFNHLADAFLNGQLYLAQPPSTHDLTQYNDHWYVPFPPLPALLMLPWVALAGLAAVQTVLFCALFGALNVALIYLILDGLTQRGWSKLNTTDNLWLTLLFGLGSVHWYMATIGSVWFVAQICTVTFVALAVWMAIWRPIGRGSPWLAGLALGLAMTGRPNVALIWLLLLGIGAMHLRTKDGQVAWPALIRWAIASAIPPLVAIAALLLYNKARFGNPLDFGYLTENVADRLKELLDTYGQFNLHYVAKNFWAMWLAGPQWDAKLNFWVPDGQGMSLLLTTPALIYLVRARRPSALTISAWVAVVTLLVPLLLYYNTGWYQFGYRFSLDFMTPVMVLLAIAAGERTTWSLRALILVGVVVNLYGVIWWYMR